MPLGLSPRTTYLPVLARALSSGRDGIVRLVVRRDSCQRFLLGNVPQQSVLRHLAGAGQFVLGARRDDCDGTRLANVAPVFLTTSTSFR